MPSHILKINDLKKYFGGIKAVDGVSFSIDAGEVVGLVGPNGSGKTTVTNLLSGLLLFTEGSITIRGVHLRKVLPWEIANHEISRTFQEVRLFPQMTVIDNLLVVLSGRKPFANIFSTSDRRHKDKAENLLTKFNLIGKKDDLAATLSYGQRKLLEIARVLAMDPDIVLLDEPYAGLFPKMVEMVNDTVKLLKAEGKSVLLIEHNMEVIQALCDRVVVMDAGKVLAEGVPNEVLRKKEVIEAYLGA
ncbi:MAG TPA: ABC transporter ATP-binding protein [Patescibacteria group bacterium]|nr:ABC transporter ATP-binding protein [Patescibacteria group bacterium]